MISEAPARRSSPGLTMIEILISGTVLLLISGLFFAIVVPILQREDWFQGQQSNIRSYVVARERLIELVGRGRIIPLAQWSTVPAPDQLLVEFYLPESVSTDSFGDMASVDRREIVVFDDVLRHQVILTGEKKLIVKAQDDSYSRLIWAMESTSNVSATVAPDLKRVDFEMGGKIEAHADQGGDWHKTISVFLP